MLRRNLEAVSGWGVKGLLWQQMERQAARRMLIEIFRFYVGCRIMQLTLEARERPTGVGRYCIMHLYRGKMRCPNSWYLKTLPE
jgi:hypothetical protein